VPELSAARLRASFLVALIDVPCTAVELLNAAGTTTLAVLDALVRNARAASDWSAP
jgi:hypothetical protein